MAQEQTAPPAKTPWTKIFTAFKVALDMKKLALAATGIFVVWAGWALLGWTFYGVREMPDWSKRYAEKEKLEEPERRQAWDTFKAERASWNLIHELAGSYDEKKPVVVDAGDVAGSIEEYILLKDWSGKTYEQAVVLAAQEVDAKKADPKAAQAALETARAALETYKTFLINPKLKKYGLLRVSPWSENRGENPYLIVANGIKTRGESVFGGGKFFSWLMTDEAPVVLEPLYKFLAPVVYLFDSRAGGWDRLYLVMIILWTLLVWGFFGGAICRIAAVQVARNERITLREALLFTKERCWSYVAAPVFPMALVGILTLLLMIFGWIEWTPWVGDLFAGVLWPVVILFGFIMAIVLVGLVGWPLMTATISTEGTDSFDALSRSYSYVYQAPWQYLWYNLVAVAYGAVLIFFIGFMASSMVFLGKWGVSTAVGPASLNVEKDREPSYLFYYAPTSFGWRDLLISSNRFAKEKAITDYDGRTVNRLEFTEAYHNEMHAMNKVGAGLMTVWIYPLFLLVIGFGYSYFWSASTIIYFLMRRHVDDTEMDEVHLEDEAMDDPFMKPPPASPAPPPVAAPSKPGMVSLNVVEAPPPAPVAAGSYTTPDHAPAPPVTSEAVNSPPDKPPVGGTS